MSIVNDDVFSFETSDISLLSSERKGVRKRFKVHRRVLKQSAVFNDMFTLGDTAEERDAADPPEVQLADDNAKDLSNMLKKVYEGQKQYGISIQTYEETDLGELARLASILEKYCFTRHLAEVKAALQSVLKARSGALYLDSIVKILPLLRWLDHRGIQEQIIEEVGSGLQDAYFIGELDWSDEPNSYGNFSEMDASLVSPEVLKRMIGRLSETLLQRQSETRVAQLERTATKGFLDLLGRPLGCSDQHRLMACWVGGASSAWQRAIIQVYPRLWYDFWVGHPYEERSFKFDLGENGERNTALKPLLELKTGNFDDCKECKRAIKAGINHVYGKYPDRVDVEAPSTIAPSPSTHTSTSARPEITVSRLFNATDADICILSSPTPSGHRTRFRIHGKLALTSPVIRAKLETQDSCTTTQGPVKVIELQEDSETIDALCRMLYSEDHTTGFLPAVSSLADASWDHLALGYLALDKLRCQGLVDKVRGYLRLELISRSYGCSLPPVVALLKHANDESDDALKQLVTTFFHTNIAAQLWLRQLATLPPYLDGLPCSDLRDLIICLLKAHGKERSRAEGLRQNVYAFSIYGSVLCHEPAIHENHELYACYKLACKPAWQTAQVKVITLFFRNLHHVPDKPPEDADESVKPGWIRFYEEMMGVLEKLDIGTECKICKQAVEDWVGSIKNNYYHEEETRKTKREEAEKKTLKRKRAEADGGQHAAEKEEEEDG